MSGNNLLVQFNFFFMYINDSGPVSYISWCFSLNLTLNALYSKLFLSFPYLQPRLPYYVSLYVLIPSLLHLSIHFFFPHSPLCLSCSVPDYCFDSHCPVELEFSCFSVCSMLDCVIVGVVKCVRSQM